MNIWNDLKQMPWSQISLNIVTLHYESSRAQRVLSCQAFFVDENTLFMIKSSMENQVWSSISLLLRKRNLPGNRGDFTGPLTKMATDLAREHSFNTRPVKISYFTWSYNPHFIFTIMPYPHNLWTLFSQLYAKCACWVKTLKFLFGPNASCIIIDCGCHFFHSQLEQFSAF